MNIITKSVLVAGVAVLGITTMFAGSPKRQGTEIVHYSARTSFTNDNVEPTAAGTVQVNEATQGSADKETMTITIKGLTASTDYSVVANTTGPTDVTPFTTDSKGGAKISFSNNSKSKNNAGSPPTPLTTLTEVDIVNSNAVAVLSADMSTPQTFAYMVKKSDTTDNVTNQVTATISISANTKGAKASIAASGLDAGNTYTLFLGGNSVQSGTATSKGTLNIKASGPADGILSVNSASLQDANSLTVWTTTIP